MSGAIPAGRASVLTPPGRGAIAVVAAEGPAATAAVDMAFHAANGRSIAQQAVDRILFGHWVSGDHREEVIVVRDAGGDLEIHCHGGHAAVTRITGALAQGGCEVVSWQSWIESRARSSIAAAAEIALAQATTRRTAAILLDQRQGALERDAAAARSDLAAGELEAAVKRLKALIARAPLGLHLSTPWRVAIAGRPNVGKSSLINALVGFQRAIVFDQPGTTRDVLTAETAIDGWPVTLSDAAGIRETDDSLEAEGVIRARRQLGHSDLVLWVIDAGALTSDPRRTAEQQWHAEGASGQRLSEGVVVVNKCDLLRRAPPPREDVLYVSALTGAGLAELLSTVSRRLVPAAPAAGEGAPFTARQVELLDRCLRHVDRGDVSQGVKLIDELLGQPVQP